METSQYLNRINFNNINKRPKVNKVAISAWLSSVAKSEKKEIREISINFCSDEYLLEMNIEYLSHDYFTDIITFDLSDKKGQIEGDIYISVDRVKENSNINETSFADELSRVIVHGLLHLIGYGDKTKSQKKEMRDKENHYLIELNM